MTQATSASAAHTPQPHTDAEPRWLSASELQSWVAFEAVAERLPTALDQPLQRAFDLTHFEYIVLAHLSEAPTRTLRMSELAVPVNATLPRLSHVVRRLEDRGLVARQRCATDGRATEVTLTDAGWDLVVQAAPVHVESVRALVLDQLTAEQITQLGQISRAVLAGIDPEADADSPCCQAGSAS